MKSTNKTKNIELAFGIAIAYILLFKACGIAIRRIITTQHNSFLPDLAVETAGTVIAVVMLIVFRKTKLLKAEPGSFQKGLSAGVFLIVGAGLNALLSLPVIIGKELKPAYEIAFFVFDMILTGVTEELIYRGVVFDYFHNAFGSSTKAGAYATSALSGAIFGILHLFNLFGSSNPSAIIIQAVAAAATGFFFGAVYLRCRNLWAMIALHAFNDFAIMLKEGLLSEGTIRSAMDSHSVKVLAGAVLYIGIGMFLLRSAKMSYIENDKKGEGLIFSGD